MAIPIQLQQTHAIKNYFKHSSDSLGRPSCYLHVYEGQDALKNILVQVQGNADSCYQGTETAFCQRVTCLWTQELLGPGLGLMLAMSKIFW